MLIVDDHNIFADALAGALDAEPDFTVIGTAATTIHALELVLFQQPELVLMDIQLGYEDGLDAARRILEMRPEVIVVIVSNVVSDHLRAGPAWH